MTKETPVEQAFFNYEEERNNLITRMCNLHISRISELPQLDLYLDQVLSLVNNELAFMNLDGETIVTGSMVNNYVKQKLVPAPIKKRYTAEHIASLLYVCSFKKVLSIAQIKNLKIACHQSEVDICAAYNELAIALEWAIASEFKQNHAIGFLQGKNVPDVTITSVAGKQIYDESADLLAAGIGLLAKKIYVEQILQLEMKKLS